MPEISGGLLVGLTDSSLDMEEGVIQSYSTQMGNSFLIKAASDFRS